jgi:hydrogenase expression/formation protein HypD
MVSVPGSRSDLSACRASGGRVEVCYSPSGAIDLARKNPDKEVVFLGIGFETTIGPVVSIVESATRENISNVSILASFKLIPPALEALLSDPGMKIDAFLCPAHVSAIIGSDAYLDIARSYRTPCVIAGFEPLDILLGIDGVLRQIAGGEALVDNQYNRVVRPGGNPVARDLMLKYLRPADAVWRGLGIIPASGLSLRPEYAAYDAERKFGITVGPGVERPGCLCGSVIKGMIHPGECPLFGSACAPEHPVGPCMVSAEGACAAAFKYAEIS